MVSRRTTLVARAVAAWVLALCCACGGKQSKKESVVDYAKNAEEAYLAALEQMQDDDCVQAETSFKEVRRKYPYSRFAALAELRAADCMFEEDKYIEAVQAYQTFVRGHPAHREVPYARFRVAESYVKQIPSSWFLTPPSYERDQTATQDALVQLRAFLTDYENHPLAKKARVMERRVVDLLARNEDSVARFYERRDNPRAAALRLETLAERYPQSTIAAQSLLHAGELRAEDRQYNRARSLWERLLERYPRSRFVPEARRALSQLAK